MREVLFETIRKIFFNIFGKERNGEVLLVTSDSAGNMKDRYHGAVTHFRIVRFLGFFRILCGTYQYDLIIELLVSSVLEKEV